MLVLIKEPSAITESEKDTGDDKYDKMKRLDEFRKKVKSDGNTVDFFTNLDYLKYSASSTFSNVIDYVDENAGWVRYRDIVDVINENVERRNKKNAELEESQQKMLEGMKEMLSQFSSRLTDLENNKLTREEIPIATIEEVKKIFPVENEPLTIGNHKGEKQL